MSSFEDKVRDYAESRPYWEKIHKYFRYAANDAVPYIKCANGDDTDLVVVAKSTGEGLPALKCFTCGTVFNIGKAVWDQIDQNLREADDAV